MRASLLFFALAMPAALFAETPVDFLGNPLPDRAVCRIGLPVARGSGLELAWNAGGAIVLARTDGIVATFDRRTGLIEAFQAGGEPEHLALSADGSRVAFLSKTKVHVWGVAERKSLFEADARASGLALSGDGQLLATQTGRRDVVVQEVPGGRVVFKGDRIEDGNYDSSVSLAFSGDGKRLFWSPSPAVAVVTKLEDGSEEGRLNGWGNACIPSPDGALCISGRGDHRTLRGFPGLDAVREIGGKDFGWGGAFAFSADSRRIALVATTVRIVDAASGDTLAEFGEVGRPRAAAWSRDGKFLAAATDEVLRTWDVDGRSEIARLAVIGEIVQGLAFSPDGKRIAVADQNFSVEQYDAETGKAAGSLNWKGGCPLWVAWSPDGRWLASGGFNPNVRVQDAETLEEIYVLPYKNAPGVAAWSPDSSELFVYDKDHGAFVVEPRTGRVRLQLDAGPTGPVAWSRDGRLLACGNPDRSVAILSADKGAPLFELRGHLDDVRYLAFSPDGALLATGSEDRTIRLWDPATGRLRTTLRGHTRSVDELVFTADSRFLLSASSDGTACLREIATGGVATTLRADGSWCTAIALSPNGRRVAVGSERGTTLVFALWAEPGSATGAPEEDDWEQLGSGSAEDGFEAARRVAACGDAGARFLAKRADAAAGALRLSRTLAALEAIGSPAARDAAKEILAAQTEEDAKSAARATVKRLEKAVGGGR